MKIAVTGGTGLVGRFIVEEASAAGDEVITLSRTAPPPGCFTAPLLHLPFDLRAEPPDLTSCDALIHLAFLHLPGRYRGGEGDDPQGFRRANVDGTLRLFDAARAAGVGRILLLSSRAVYGSYPAGTPLTEATPPRPDTLYGEVKLAAEQALASLARDGIATASLRATGVYGAGVPGRPHKWSDLFDTFAKGGPIAPRVASEVHGADLAAACRLLLNQPAQDLTGQAFNLSDIVLDRHDLLAEVARLTGSTCPLPPRADASKVSVMACDRLQQLGWRPGGFYRLRETLPSLLGPSNAGR